MSGLPSYIPMLAVRWPTPFSDPEWAFETKWDGIRAIIYSDAGTVRLQSRTGRDLTKTYPETAVAPDPRPIVLDGEIVAFDANGRPSFGTLAQRMNLQDSGQIRKAATALPLSLVVFDILFLDGDELTQLPWNERRSRLEQLKLPPPYVCSQVELESGEALWEAISAESLEGMVAKRITSRYRPGQRSPDWRKIALVQRIRAVVGGYSLGEGARSASFGSLLLGLVDGERLRYIGSVGTGFDAQTLRMIRDALDQMGTREMAFYPDPEIPRHSLWVEPHLVAEVEFKEWTGPAKLRAPSFKGFTGEAWQMVTWEREGPSIARPGKRG